VRTDPIAATDAQYFTGSEQDSLDRELIAKEFHNLLLSTGDVPLDVLALVVDEWVATQQKAP
jgi:uncharacterized protein (DUF885 family)